MNAAVASPFALTLDVRTTLGESPVWDAKRGLLWFVDIKGRRLHRFDPATGRSCAADIAEDIGCVAPALDGTLIAGLRSGLWRLSEDGALLARLADNPEDQATSRFNDGRTDPAGRFLAGTIDEPKAGGKAHLYRYDQRGLIALASGLLTSNGLAFSPDGKTLYHADTPRFLVSRYDYDPASGNLANRRPFIQLEPTAQDRGRPDGAAVDSQGCYWTALYEGGRVHRYDPDGHLMAIYPVPARNPTMPAFGGADMKTLFVTTASAEGDANPGALWAMEAPVPGLVSPPFNPAA
jgi:sugar lactone lactonase YvrE